MENGDEGRDDTAQEPGGAPGEPGDAATAELAAHRWQPDETPVSHPIDGDPGGPTPHPTPPVGPMPLSMPPYSPPQPATGVEPAIGAPRSGSESPPPGPPWYPPDTGAFGAYPPPPPPASPAADRRRVWPVALVAALLAGGLGAGIGVSVGGSSTPVTSSSGVPVIPATRKPTQVGSGPSESTAAIAKAAIPAIVDINTVVASATADGQEQEAGTGMILTSSGEILTNNHVVKDATKISVSVQGHTGSYAAAVIGVNPTLDVALLQVEGLSGTLPTIDLGNSSSAVVGTPVVAIGNAQGLDQTPTTVTGTVSALDQSINASDNSPTGGSESLHGLIETDAPIEPGDSGGPLLDDHGQVIGMDTAASTAPNSGATLGFAIPIDEARAVVRLMEEGRTSDGNVLGLSPFLGIFEEPNGFGFGSAAAGVSVSDVAINGPAQGAGIVGGDTITKIDSTPTPTIAVLQRAIAKDKPGDTVTVTYLDTTGVAHTASVTLAGIPK